MPKKSKAADDFYMPARPEFECCQDYKEYEKQKKAKKEEKRKKKLEELKKKDPEKAAKEMEKDEEKKAKQEAKERKERQQSSRNGPNMDRVEMLARPHSRRLRSLWEEKACMLPKERRDKIKSALEEDYFLSPEQTEMYFQSLNEGTGGGRLPPMGVMGMMSDPKEMKDREREFKQRQKWLCNFSAQVAYHLCDYLTKGQKETLVSNRLRVIADVVLERVAEILGEAKPSRNNPGRLARFMVAISDRIAVWIENAVYRAEEPEPVEYGATDDHMKFDTDGEGIGYDPEDYCFCKSPHFRLKKSTSRIPMNIKEIKQDKIYKQDPKYKDHPRYQQQAAAQETLGTNI